MRFHAFDLSLELVHALRAILSRLDSNLKRHVREAASSVSLNLAEGAGRFGKDRLYHYRIALG